MFTHMDYKSKVVILNGYIKVSIAVFEFCNIIGWKLFMIQIASFV